MIIIIKCTTYEKHFQRLNAVGVCITRTSFQSTAIIAIITITECDFLLLISTPISKSVNRLNSTKSALSLFMYVSITKVLTDYFFLTSNAKFNPYPSEPQLKSNLMKAIIRNITHGICEKLPIKYHILDEVIL